MTCYRNGSFGLEIERAAQFYVHQTLRSMPSDEEIRKSHTFSDEYKQNMTRLMREVADSTSRVRRKEYITQGVRYLQRCAIVIAIFVVLSLMVTMSVEAVRTPLLNFVVEFFDDHVRITTPYLNIETPIPKESSEVDPLEQYVSRLKELGYEEENFFDVKNWTSYVLKGDVGLTLARQNYSDFTTATIDYSQGTEKSFSFKDIYFVYSSNRNIVYWQIDNDVYYIRSSQSREDLIKIIEYII